MKSCISLKLRLRLPPARKAWKSFTSTLGKLHRSKSKAMKKHRKHSKTSTKSVTKAPPKFHVTKRFRHKKLATFRSFMLGFHKKPSPVYIDKLFREPSCDLVRHLKPQTAHKPQSAKFCEEEGTTKESGSSASDDMWESLALASPLMHGIDERAEEFIARFRQEMAAEEMLTRNL